MLTGSLAVILFLALVLHLLLVEQPRRKASLVKPALPQPLPVAEAVTALPDGVFLQPTFTWIRLRDNGDLLLGIHPLIVSLVGAPYKLDLIPEGWQIRKGMPLLKIRQGRRSLQVFSPVNGRIAEVNPNACMEKGWTRPKAGDDCWVYRIEPENASVEFPLWLLDEKARSWSRGRYGEVKDYLAKATEAEDPDGPTQGPDLPVGVLAGLDKKVWLGFQGRFLASSQDAPPSLRR